MCVFKTIPSNKKRYVINSFQKKFERNLRHIDFIRLNYLNMHINCFSLHLLLPLLRKFVQMIQWDHLKKIEYADKLRFIEEMLILYWLPDLWNEFLFEVSHSCLRSFMNVSKYPCWVNVMHCDCIQAFRGDLHRNSRLWSVLLEWWSVSRW